MPGLHLSANIGKWFSKSSSWTSSPMPEALLPKTGLDPVTNSGYKPNTPICSWVQTLASRVSIANHPTNTSREIWKASKAEVSNIHWYKCSQTSEYTCDLFPYRQRTSLWHKATQCTLLVSGVPTTLLLLSSLKPSVIQLTQWRILAVESFFSPSLKGWAKAGERRGSPFMSKRHLQYRVRQSECRHQLSFPRVWENYTWLLISATASLNWFFSISAINSH